MRAEQDEWFANRDPFAPKLIELMDLGVFLPLREKDDHNRQVFIIRTAAHDPKQSIQNDVFKVMCREHFVFKSKLNNLFFSFRLEK